MENALWFLQMLLAASFVATGLIRLIQAREQRLRIADGWFEDVASRLLRACGLIEISTAVVLIALATTAEDLPAIAAIFATGFVATTARLASTTTLNSGSRWTGTTAPHAGYRSPKFNDRSGDAAQSATLPRIWRFDVLSNAHSEQTAQRTVAPA
jgi:hypothetical protein